MRTLVVSLLAAGCVLAVSACGGGGSSAGSSSSSTSSDAEPVGAALYTHAVCTALSAWEQHLESASAVLAQRTNTATSLTRVRTEFVTFFGGAIGRTDGMLTAVEEAGVPDVNNGEKVAAALLRSLHGFRPILVEARAKARRLPVGDEQLFTTQAQTLGAPFGAERAKLATLFETLGKRFGAPELTRAADADATCREL
jgi:hypothetical protein